MCAFCTYCVYICTIQQNKDTQIMTTTTFTSELQKAYNLKFDFNDGDFCTDLQVECESFNFIFSASANTTTQITQASYLQPAESTVYGRIELSDVVMFDNDGEEMKITENQIKELEQLINDNNL